MNEKRLAGPLSRWSIRWGRRKNIAPLIILAIAIVGFADPPISFCAQQDPCLNRSIAVDVQTTDGHFVDGLSAKNFRATVHGQKIEVSRAARDHSPRRIVLVLDASGSMRDKWDFEIHVARTLVAYDQQSALALIVFSTHVDNKVDFAEGRKRVADELASLATPGNNRIYGRTALFDALVAATDLLRPGQFGDAIYLISDGGDNHSKAGEPTCKGNLLNAGVRLYAVLPTEPMASRGRTSEEAGGPAGLSQLANESGGSCAFFEKGISPAYLHQTKDGATTMLSQDGQHTFQMAIVGFANEIAQPYRLDINLPAPLDKPRNWKLDVVDPQGETNKHWRISYPRRLAVCP